MFLLGQWGGLSTMTPYQVCLAFTSYSLPFRKVSIVMKLFVIMWLRMIEYCFVASRVIELNECPIFSNRNFKSNFIWIQRIQILSKEENEVYRPLCVEVKLSKVIRFLRYKMKEIK